MAKRKKSYSYIRTSRMFQLPAADSSDHCNWCLLTAALSAVPCPVPLSSAHIVIVLHSDERYNTADRARHPRV